MGGSNSTAQNEVSDSNAELPVSSGPKFQILWSERVQRDIFPELNVKVASASEVEAPSAVSEKEAAERQRESFMRGYTLAQSEARNELDRRLREMQAEHKRQHEEVEKLAQALVEREKTREASDIKHVDEILRELEKNRPKPSSGRFAHACASERQQVLQCYANSASPLLCMDMAQAFRQCAEQAKRDAFDVSTGSQ